jgi:hypothetical protein
MSTSSFVPLVMPIDKGTERLPAFGKTKKSRKSKLSLSMIRGGRCTSDSVAHAMSYDCDEDDGVQVMLSEVDSTKDPIVRLVVQQTCEFAATGSTSSQRKCDLCSENALGSEGFVCNSQVSHFTCQKCFVKCCAAELAATCCPMKRVELSYCPHSQPAKLIDILRITPETFQDVLQDLRAKKKKRKLCRVVDQKHANQQGSVKELCSLILFCLVSGHRSRTADILDSLPCHLRHEVEVLCNDELHGAATVEALREQLPVTGIRSTDDVRQDVGVRDDTRRHQANDTHQAVKGNLGGGGCHVMPSMQQKSEVRGESRQLHAVNQAAVMVDAGVRPSSSECAATGERRRNEILNSAAASEEGSQKRKNAVEANFRKEEWRFRNAYLAAIANSKHIEAVEDNATNPAQLEENQAPSQVAVQASSVSDDPLAVDSSSSASEVEKLKSLGWKVPEQVYVVHFLTVT